MAEPVLEISDLRKSFGALKATDGVSLTLVTVGPDAFSVMLIPHTLGATTLGLLQPGARVNVETDILAKHVQKLLGQAR